MKSIINWNVVDLKKIETIPEFDKQIVFLMDTVDFGGPLGKENQGISIGSVVYEKDNPTDYLLTTFTKPPFRDFNILIPTIENGFTWCYIDDILTEE